MKQHTTYQDLSSMLSEDRSDMNTVDFIELCLSLQYLITREKEKAQQEINQGVEKLVDSFGGRNCTMRSLKGDL